MAPPQSQSTSMERLHHVEKRIVRVLELAAEAMDDLAYTTGPRMDALFAHCREFMQCIKDIQETLRQEITSACEYRPFEKSDYNARMSSEVCVQKLEYLLIFLNEMKHNTDELKHNTDEMKHDNDELKHNTDEMKHNNDVSVDASMQVEEQIEADIVKEEWKTSIFKV
ncbi:Mediator of RNA polymerase II transcription subunit 11 [Zostera marina]|uniref:Mediator of RNA polymerase II transcription subunit 11 n=1 Tax=Zostera marina TaxID=29655 RepID=A0A0K9Q613_ZOSMR|nr:Mediator of RNA polymerase II transcription subunit 11 [Zostera marina]